MIVALLVVGGCATPTPPADPIGDATIAAEPSAAATAVPPEVSAATLAAARDAAVAYQHRWLDAPPAPLHADAAIAAHALRELVPGPEVDRLVVRVTEALEGRTEPLQRLWDPSLTLEAAHTTSWAPSPDERVNPNRVLVEAAYCADNGWRPQTTTYACGAMRDEGGFHTAHAAWGLAMAVERGCVPREQTCLDDLAVELLAAATRDPAPTTTLQADLLAERILFARLAGTPRAQLTPHLATLLSVQADDGSFGSPEPDERPYWRYHAAMGGAWAIAVYEVAP